MPEQNWTTLCRRVVREMLDCRRRDKEAPFSFFSGFLYLSSSISISLPLSLSLYRISVHILKSFEQKVQCPAGRSHHAGTAEAA